MMACLVHGCYTPVRAGRCPEHQPARTDEPTRNRAPHRVQGRRYDCTGHALRTGATCGLCGHHQQPPAATQSRWNWHHVNPGDPSSMQVPTHAFCNMSFGDGSSFAAGVAGAAEWRLKKIEEGKIEPYGASPLTLLT